MFEDKYDVFIFQLADIMNAKKIYSLESLTQ